MNSELQKACETLDFKWKDLTLTQVAALLSLLYMRHSETHDLCSRKTLERVVVVVSTCGVKIQNSFIEWVASLSNSAQPICAYGTQSVTEEKVVYTITTAPILKSGYSGPTTVELPSGRIFVNADEWTFSSIGRPIYLCNGTYTLLDNTTPKDFEWIKQLLTEFQDTRKPEEFGLFDEVPRLFKFEETHKTVTKTRLLVGLSTKAWTFLRYFPKNSPNFEGSWTAPNGLILSTQSGHGLKVIPYYPRPDLIVFFGKNFYNNTVDLETESSWNQHTRRTTALTFPRLCEALDALAVAVHEAESAPPPPTPELWKGLTQCMGKK